MKIHQVPILNDYPQHRGSFIQSTASNDMAFLDERGKMSLISRPVASAILCLFDELKDRAVEKTPFWQWLAMTKEAKKVFEGAKT